MFDNELKYNQVKKALERILLLLHFFSFSALFAFGQEGKTQKIIEAIIEAQPENFGEETNVALIIEDLEDLLENPVNINSTNERELSRLYLLNSVQINNLLNYIEESGPVFSIYELKTVDGFTPELLQKIQPFVAFREKPEEPLSVKERMKHGKQELLLRSTGLLQKAVGYRKKSDGSIPYEGNRLRYYARYRYQIRNKLSFGITAEKDPGEAFFKGSNKKGFDYYSAHLSWNPGRNINQLTVGDFIVRSGQGLALWQGFSRGKTGSVLSVSKNGQGIRPSVSVDENAFFRGVAGVFCVGKTSVSLFCSHKKVDGNVETDENGEEYFTSLQTSGYHRTESEIASEKSVETTNAGGVFTATFKKLKLGATAIFQHFDKSFIRSSQLCNQYLFSGSENYTGSVDYLFCSGKYQLFGEAAISKSKGLAFVQGAVVHISDRLGISSLVRHFDKDYHALWGNAFAENSNTNNETGWYLGMRFLPVKFVTFSAYADLFRSEWINYTTAGPSNGRDIFAQVDVNMVKKINFYIRYKNEEKDRKYKAGKQYANRKERTQKTRLHFNYKISDCIGLKTRFEHALFKNETTEHGFLVFQDIHYSSPTFPLKVAARLSWFNTDSYNSRIYTYENDLLYTFSVPALYGKGLKTYLTLKYELRRNIDLWLKFEHTHLTDREIISSGYNQINGNNKTMLKFMLRLKI